MGQGDIQESMALRHPQPPDGDDDNEVIIGGRGPHAGPMPAQ